MSAYVKEASAVCHANEGTHSHFDSHYSPPASFISAARLRMHLTFFFGGGGGGGVSCAIFLNETVWYDLLRMVKRGPPLAYDLLYKRLTSYSLESGYRTFKNKHFLYILFLLRVTARKWFVGECCLSATACWTRHAKNQLLAYSPSTSASPSSKQRLFACSPFDTAITGYIITKHLWLCV